GRLCKISLLQSKSSKDLFVCHRALARGFIDAYHQICSGGTREMFRKEASKKMANPKNTAELAELKEKIAESSPIVITEYRGLSVAQLQELRTNLGFDVDYSVAKNTLFKIAANE